MKRDFLVTCEHASNAVPEEFAGVFAGDPAILRTHRAWDPGTREVAEQISRELGLRPFCGVITRLLVDLNRSVDNPEIFSSFARNLSPGSRERLLQRYYHPYRQAVTERVSEAVLRNPVLHLSIHSFVPVLDGACRDFEVGLLFDPQRAAETAFCEYLKSFLEERPGKLRVRFNEPYPGIADGLTTALRQQFVDSRYLGIEIELNQALGGKEMAGIADLIVDNVQ